MLMNGKDEAAAFLFFFFLEFETTAVLNEVNDTHRLGSAVGKPPRDDSRLFVVGKKCFFPIRTEISS